MDSDLVELLIEDAQYTLKVVGKGARKDSVRLWAPRKTQATNGGYKMKKIVDEMLAASIHVILTRLSDGHVLFEQTGRKAGLEIEYVEQEH